jgi:hypothetical protein
MQTIKRGKTFKNRNILCLMATIINSPLKMWLDISGSVIFDDAHTKKKRTALLM